MSETAQTSLIAGGPDEVETEADTAVEESAEQGNAEAVSEDAVDDTAEGSEEDAELVFGKYKDIEAAQEAFKTLESENGKLRREKHPEAPEEYTYDFSGDEDLADIVPADFDFKEDPLMQMLEPVFKENNYSQDQVNAAVKTFLQYQASEAPNPKAEMEALGAEGPKLIEGAKSFRGLKAFNEDERAIIESWTTTGAEVALVNKINKMVSATKTIPSGEAALSASTSSSNDLYSAAKKIKDEAGSNFQYNTTAQALYEKKMDEAVAAEEREEKGK